MNNKAWKRVMAGLLASALVVGGSPANVGTGGLFGGTAIVVQAEEGNTLKGQGTQDDPYQIASIDDLKLYMDSDEYGKFMFWLDHKYWNESYLQLTNNIEFESDLSISKPAIILMDGKNFSANSITINKECSLKLMGSGSGSTTISAEKIINNGGLVLDNCSIPESTSAEEIINNGSLFLFNCSIPKSVVVTNSVGIYIYGGIFDGKLVNTKSAEAVQIFPGDNGSAPVVNWTLISDGEDGQIYGSIYIKAGTFSYDPSGINGNVTIDSDYGVKVVTNEGVTVYKILEKVRFDSEPDENEKVFAKTNTALVNVEDFETNDEGSTVMYVVTTDETEPTDGWSENVPTAENLEEGIYYVWYKALGSDEYVDSDVQYVTVNVVRPAATVTFDLDSEYAVENATASDDDDNTYTAKAGDTVSIYTNTYTESDAISVVMGDGTLQVEALTGEKEIDGTTYQYGFSFVIPEDIEDGAAITVKHSHIHSYGAPVWTWSDDYKTATAVFTCEEGDDAQRVEAEVSEEITPATDTTEGKIVYTATATFGGKTYTDTKSIPKYVVIAEKAVGQILYSGKTFEVGDYTIAIDGEEVQCPDGILTLSKMVYVSEKDDDSRQIQLKSVSTIELGNTEYRSIEIGVPFKVTGSDLRVYITMAKQTQTLNKNLIYKFTMTPDGTNATLYLENAETGTRIYTICTQNDIGTLYELAGTVRYIHTDVTYLGFNLVEKEVLIKSVDINGITTSYTVHGGSYTSADYTVPSAPYMDGYNFTGWSVNDTTYTTADEAQGAVETLVKAGTAVTVKTVYEKKPDKFNVTVKGGKLSDGATSGTYQVSTVMKVTANKAESGKKFSHWTRDGVKVSSNETYSFYMPSKDITLEAVYVEEATEIGEGGTAIIENVTPNASTNKVAFVSVVNVPISCTLLKGGVVATNNAAIGANVTDSNASFVRYGTPTKNSTKTYKYTWTKGSITADTIWYVRSYLVYKDANGVEHTVYGDAVKVNINGIMD